MSGTREEDAPRLSKKELDNCVFLDRTLVSEAPEVADLVSVLYEQLEADLQLIRHKPRYRDQLQLLVLNLFQCYLIGPDKYLACSRAKNEYSVPQRYDPLELGYNMIKRNMDWLAEKGYIDKHIGYMPRNGKALLRGKVTRIRFTGELVHLFDKYQLTQSMLSHAKGAELVILKDTIKRGNTKIRKLVDYVDTPETKRIRKHLEKYNALLANTVITKNGEVQPPVCYHRVFSRKSWDKGGRFYDHWFQQQNKEERLSIQINGNPVVEVDYDNMHLAMLYHMKGIDHQNEMRKNQGSWYDIDYYKFSELVPEANYDPEKDKLYDSYRDEVKVAVLIMLNATTDRSASNAIRDAINDGWDRESNTPSPVSELPFSISQLMKDIKSYHHVIADAFCNKNSTGLFLQNKDSLVMERIISKLCFDQEVPVLGIHDSIVIEECFLDLAEDALFDSYEEVMNGIATYDHVDLKKHLKKKKKKEERRKRLSR